jgi:hypothetical protein
MRALGIIPLLAAIFGAWINQTDAVEVTAVEYDERLR